MILGFSEVLEPVTVLPAVHETSKDVDAIANTLNIILLIFNNLP
jgi:hypothetical protein